MSTAQHVGTRIRELRKIRKMTVRQLAAKAAVSTSTLQKYESGDCNPPALLDHRR
ncbi:helix-turn-helix transcriptional regulator [Streptomyces olivoreticuli]